MNLRRFKATLLQHPGKAVRFLRPDGESVPFHFHVTEVGHVTRRFIDCGGTVRAIEACLLQAWVPNGDSEHRLTASKLTQILELSQAVIPSDDLEVEVEYDAGTVAQYSVGEVRALRDALVFSLGNKKTDCLAREACGLEPAAAGTGCCGGAGCGCG